MRSLPATGELRAWSIPRRAAAVDLQSWGKARPQDISNSVAKFLGCSYSENPEIWTAATPATHAGKSSPPFLFLHGTADTTVPYRQSQETMKLLQTAGVHADMFTAEGAGHGFFNRPPWFQPTLDRMEQFFTRFLK
jgi:dipeptidyl aminopeptidase/acylaminoacyl peptidase